MDADFQLFPAEAGRLAQGWGTAEAQLDWGLLASSRVMDLAPGSVLHRAAGCRPWGSVTSTSAGVSLQFRTSMTVMMSKVASSRRLRRTFTSSSVISGPGEKKR